MRGRERERDISHLLVHFQMLSSAVGERSLRPGAGNSIQVSFVCVRFPNLSQSSPLLPKVPISRKLVSEVRMKIWTQALWYECQTPNCFLNPLNQTRIFFCIAWGFFFFLISSQLLGDADVAGQWAVFWVVRGWKRNQESHPAWDWGMLLAWWARMRLVTYVANTTPLAYFAFKHLRLNFFPGYCCIYSLDPFW